jgi:hypothetical protein
MFIERKQKEVRGQKSEVGTKTNRLGSYFCILTSDFAFYFSDAVFAHFASVLSNGYAFAGASIVPVNAVLKGTILP